VDKYETIFSLPGTTVNVVTPTPEDDPGQQNNDYQMEATLDVERVIGTAPGAQPDLVVSSEASGGLITAISYNVQVLVDPIMTLSYISCEVNTGHAMTNFFASLFSQGAAEGISTLVSAGDSDAGGCDPHNMAPPAIQSPSVNAYCSSGFVTCVGGTEFNDTANPHLYWANTNTATQGSALSYIPEGVWNEPTASSGTTIIDAGGGGVSLYNQTRVSNRHGGTRRRISGHAGHQLLRVHPRRLCDLLR
jgi:pseudomonalisin